MLQPPGPRIPIPRPAARDRAGLLPGHCLRRADPATAPRHPGPRLGQPALLGAARLARRGTGAARHPARRRRYRRDHLPDRQGAGRGPVFGVLTETIQPPTRPGTCSTGSAWPERSCWSRPSTGSSPASSRHASSPPTASAWRRRSRRGRRGDWKLAARGRRQIRACTPAPGAWTELDGARVKLGPVTPRLRTRGRRHSAPGPGELLVQRDGVLAGTGSTPVQLGDVQPDGKRRMARPTGPAACVWRPADRSADGAGIERDRGSGPGGQRAAAGRAPAPRPRPDAAAPTRPAGRHSTCCWQCRTGTPTPTCCCRSWPSAGCRPGRRPGHRTELRHAARAGQLRRGAWHLQRPRPRTLDPAVRECSGLAPTSCWHQNPAHAAVATSVDLVNEAAGPRPAASSTPCSVGWRPAISTPGWRSPRRRGPPTRPGTWPSATATPWVVRRSRRARRGAGGRWPGPRRCWPPTTSARPSRCAWCRAWLRTS